MKIKILVLILLINISQISFGQKGLTFSLGFGSQAMIAGDFKSFTHGYNDVLKSQIDKKMHLNGIPLSYQFGVNLFLSEKFGMGFNYSYSRFDFRATFNSKESRDIVIKYGTPLDFGMLYKVGKTNYLSFRFGFATSSIISEYIYPDGTRSINKGMPLNGVYSTFGSFYRFDFIIGAIKNLKLTVGITLFRGSSDYNDKNYAKGLGDGDFFMFPKDYQTYNDLYNQGTLYDFPIEKTLMMKSTQINIGVIYFINLVK